MDENIYSYENRCENCDTFIDKKVMEKELYEKFECNLLSRIEFHPFTPGGVTGEFIVIRTIRLCDECQAAAEAELDARNLHNF